MQLPVQKALLEDSQPWANEEEDVLEALEAQEGLGSGVDLLAAPEPHLVPVTCAEPVPEVAAPAEVGTEPGDPVVVVETSPAVVEDVPAETVVTEATLEDKPLTEPTENEPAPEPEVAVKTEAPAAEEVTPVSAEVSSENATPSVEIVASEPAEASVVKEEVAEVTETPAEVAAPVEAPVSNAAPATAPARPHESSEPGETASSAPSETIPQAPNEAAPPTPSETAAPASTEAAPPAPNETAALAPSEVEVVATEPSTATTECAAPSEAAAAAVSDAAAQSEAAVPSEAALPPAEAAVPEPQPGLTAPAEPVPEVAVPAEVGADPEASEGGLEAPPSVENAVPVETVAADLTTEAKPLVEATEKEPAADSIVA